MNHNVVLSKGGVSQHISCSQKFPYAIPLFQWAFLAHRYKPLPSTAVGISLRAASTCVSYPRSGPIIISGIVTHDVVGATWSQKPRKSQRLIRPPLDSEVSPMPKSCCTSRTVITKSAQNRMKAQSSRIQGPCITASASASVLVFVETQWTKAVEHDMAPLCLGRLEEATS